MTFKSNNPLDFVGNTPMIELQNTNNSHGNILVKLEAFNPGGSIKTRTALGMIIEAERNGQINENSILVEPTSGNQGIGIALVAAIKGYRAKIVMPESMSTERRKMIENLGAEIDISPDGNNISETFDNCKSRARELAEQDSRVFILNQFENKANPNAHRLTTAKEIIEQTGEQIDAFVAGVGTGGTLTGVGEVLKQKYPEVKIIAVEPEKAAVLSQSEISSHIQQGIGDGFIPGVLNQDIIDEVLTVTDEEALETAKSLNRRDGLFSGISSGTNVFAAMKIAEKLPPSANIVTVLPDSGDRYFSTPLFS
ncbi:cysteine synthase A [Natranaerobius thermophilus JW/NM-WN-LF]|nr:cysteine synthase A [Natranaerobius thermophilus]